MPLAKARVVSCTFHRSGAVVFLAAVIGVRAARRSVNARAPNTKLISLTYWMQPSYPCLASRPLSAQLSVDQCPACACALGGLSLSSHALHASPYTRTIIDERRRNLTRIIDFPLLLWFYLILPQFLWTDANFLVLLNSSSNKTW